MTNAPDDFRDTRDDRDVREPRRNDRPDFNEIFKHEPGPCKVACSRGW